jgi:hypothetical protein
MRRSADPPGDRFMLAVPTPEPATKHWTGQGKDNEMTTDRPTAASSRTAGAASTPATSAKAPEPDGHRLRNSPEPGPLDWDAAVRAASALLHRQSAPPGSIGDPAATDMAHDLAARLCAYDELASAVDHMLTQADFPPPKK